MRADMRRVIIDTTRSAALPGEHRLPKNIEDWPTYEGMRRRYRDYKGFGDRLRPLWRYLDKQVGRLWVDVWSDICAHADARSIDGYHLRTHVKQSVRERPDGSDFRYGYVDADGRPTGYTFRWRFWVDEKGVLRRHE